MTTQLVEVTNGPRNWGKFLVGEFTSEWTHQSVIDPGAPLLRRVGWTPNHVLVVDLQTGEGGVFKLGGHAASDLNKTRVWVCPMFEPFLVWLYARHREVGLEHLPAHVDLPDAPFSMQGYRRKG